MGEDLRGLGPPHCRSGRARFFQFDFRQFHSQRHPFPGEGIEFLVSRELPAHFPHKLRPNERGGAFATLGIAELVKRAVLLGVNGIYTLATRSLARGVLLRQRPGAHRLNVEQFALDVLDLRLDLLSGFARHSVIV